MLLYVVMYLHINKTMKSNKIDQIFVSFGAIMIYIYIYIYQKIKVNKISHITDIKLFQLISHFLRVLLLA